MIEKHLAEGALLHDGVAALAGDVMDPRRSGGKAMIADHELQELATVGVKERRAIVPRRVADEPFAGCRPVFGADCQGHRDILPADEAGEDALLFGTDDRPPIALLVEIHCPPEGQEAQASMP